MWAPCSTAWALLFYAFGLVAHSVVEIITRAFYAMHDTRTPVLIGGGAMILNVVFSLLFINWIGVPGYLPRGPFAGLALANTTATTLEAALLLVLIVPRVGGLQVAHTLQGVAKVGLASAGMAAVLWLLMPVVERLGLIAGLGIGILGGVLTFVGLAAVLRTEEMALISGVIARRLGHR